MNDRHRQQATQEYRRFMMEQAVETNRMLSGDSQTGPVEPFSWKNALVWAGSIALVVMFLLYVAGQNGGVSW